MADSSVRYITRKTMLYKTAVEYGDYTMNHVQGCSHGCRYPCYAYLIAKRFGKVLSYEDWCRPAIVTNTLELLDAEIPKLKNKIDNVQLCFTTDPFMYGFDEIAQMSLAAIEKLNDAGIPCTVLSKGVLPPELANLSDENVYGITLVSLDEGYRSANEPGAAPYEERLRALEHLRQNGCRTWVSMEPYPTPNIVDQDLDDILQRVSFADRIIFGRTNYSKAVSSFPHAKEWYASQARRVMAFCEVRGIDCYIKRGTMPAPDADDAVLEASVS